MMERPSVVGVTTDKKVAKVTPAGRWDQPGTAARVFHDLAGAEINSAPHHPGGAVTRSATGSRSSRMWNSWTPCRR